MEKKHILLCDDNEDILEVCKLILERNNFLVSIASTCESALEMVDVVKPDLILMDLSMPEMGGEQAIVRLKANEKTRTIPVIILSANHQIEKVAGRSQANGYIRKPFEVTHLVTTINTHLISTL